ncbi:MAG TPA: hypothetical protein VHR45_24140 [Thermoanaerobaculia bacterium]|nr:hypothetical protein [Thermoanaerobaculia bacterium]
MTRPPRLPASPAPPVVLVWLARAAQLASFIVLLLLLLPAAASAQDVYTWTAGLLGGIGGSTDVKPGSNFGNPSFQLDLIRVTEPRTQVGLRLGNISLSGQHDFGALHRASLAYATLAGEYLFDEGYYTSGVYVGIGGYRLRGTGQDGRSQDKTSAGGTFGLTGEFKIRRWVGVLVELSGHYTDLKDSHIFGMAHAGFSLHFR